MPHIQSLIFFLLWIILFPSSLAKAESLRVVLMERIGQIRLTSNRPFFSKTVSDRMAVEAAYTSALVTKMSGVAINETDTFEKTVIFTPQRGGRLSVNGVPYSGDIRVHAKNGHLMVVNEVDIEQYLRGVIPSEMPHEWPMEALKTQAVISRTYALYQKKENQNKEHDLPASVLGQVYKGESASHHRTDRAITETHDMVVTYDGELALTFFHSTSAGHTEDAKERWGIDLPYLKGVSCPFDRDSPYYQWERSIPLSDLEEAMAKNGVKTISTLTPFQYSRAGRILDVRILHQGGETFFKAEGLRRILGYRTLPSTNFRINSFGKIMKITGMGWGHGVGLCQYGTKVLAERGFTFDEIIPYYYPGVVLEIR